ncbi:MAG TPA: hypothetical protein VNT81_12560 [Vicinamibacterales bacterium]|nr:hypothetical protein [Vicinamibacterales bacterium]
MTLVELIAAALTVVLGAWPLAAYAIDAAGGGVMPAVSLIAALGIGALVAWRLPKAGSSSWADVAAWIGIVVFVTAMILRMSWPALLPPGRGPDLTHHLLLVDYIEQQGHLVHDRALDGAMGEMAHYTPASHLLAVMAGKLAGTDGLRAFFPLVALCSALTAGFVFLIARRLAMTLPFALAAAILLFLPAPYFTGAFTHDAFLAQAVATLFAVAAWWALTAWGSQPSDAAAWTMAVLLSAIFLSWPVYLGPALVVFAAMLMSIDLPLPAKQRQLGIVIVPVLALFLLHSWDRWGWMLIVRVSGAVMHPSGETIGWALPVLATIGAVAAFSDTRARLTVILLFVIALQALTLFVLAEAQGADTPYMALKMVYLAVYPMAVLGGLALFRLVGRSRLADNLGWVVAALLILAVRPAFTAPRPVPVVDLDLYEAGKSLRAQGITTCVDYLVNDAETAYWLHLAVLGNPRASERMREIDRYDPNAAMAPWITAEGRTFAIADLRLLPDEIRSRVTLTAQFGHAGVITGRGATMKGCD